MKTTHLVTGRASAATALALALLTLGCLGRSPGVRQFTLGSVPDRAVSARPAGAGEFAVGLGPVTFPPYLRRPQLGSRGADSELVIDALHRWAGGFEANVLRALADDLSLRIGTPWVVLAAEDAPFPAAFRVAVDFLRFEAQSSDELLLRARWVIREQGGDGVWSGESAIRKPLDGRGVRGLVAAHEAALSELADAIAAPLARAAPRAAQSADGSTL